MTRTSWTVAIVLGCASAAAAPGKVAAPQRKPASEQYPLDALSEFVDGIISDKEGDLDHAERHFAESNKLSAQANTYYNLADVLRRMERLTKAIEAYKQYVALAPDAKDRPDVERLIDQLEHSDATVVIDGEEPDTIVLVDGQLIGPSPQVVHLPEGDHMAHRVSPTVFQKDDLHVKSASFTHASMHRQSKDVTGNVIIANNRSGISGSWTDRGVHFTMNGRMTLAPGHYETTMSSHRLCTPIVFDVPRGDDLTFVYVEMKLPSHEPGAPSCTPIVVRQQKVHFAP